VNESFRALNDILEKISEVYDQLGTENLWWRGQPEAGLNLIPRLYRRPNPRHREINMVLNFDRQAHLRYPAWPLEKSHRLLLMQHYGLPTRLLYWTMGVLTALYFAVGDDNYNDKDAALWALNPVKLNRKMTDDRITGVLNHEETDIKNHIDRAFKAKTAGDTPEVEILAMTGPELDLRMLVQWGAYTIHSTDLKIEEIPTCEEFLSKIIIPQTDRPHLKHALHIAGFYSVRLFPDLQSLAKDSINLYGY